MITANNKVKIGVMPFRIPATELSTFVCASAYKNAGNAFPVKPIIIRDFQSAHFVFFRYLNPKGKNAIAERLTRNMDSSTGEKASSDFFMSMKEPPQMILRNINKKMASNCLLDLI